MEVGYSLNKESGKINYIMTLGKNNQIGAYYCLFNIKTNYYYRAKTEVTCFGINCFEMQKALKKFPKLENQLKEITRKNYEEKMFKTIESDIHKEIFKFNKSNPSIKIEKFGNHLASVKIFFITDQLF